jgi:hypothetical protein
MLLSQVFGVASLDLWTVVTAILLVTGAAPAATYETVRRATRVDPMTTLRYE